MGGSSSRPFLPETAIVPDAFVFESDPESRGLFHFEIPRCAIAHLRFALTRAPE
jgi:hypothetical protein